MNNSYGYYVFYKGRLWCFATEEEYYEYIKEND